MASATSALLDVAVAACPDEHLGDLAAHVGALSPSALHTLAQRSGALDGDTRDRLIARITDTTATPVTLRVQLATRHASDGADAARILSLATTSDVRIAARSAIGAAATWDDIGTHIWDAIVDAADEAALHDLFALTTIPWALDINHLPAAGDDHRNRIVDALDERARTGNLTRLTVEELDAVCARSTEPGAALRHVAAHGFDGDPTDHGALPTAEHTVTQLAAHAAEIGTVAAYLDVLGALSNHTAWVLWENRDHLIAAARTAWGPGAANSVDSQLDPIWRLAKDGTAVRFNDLVAHCSSRTPPAARDIVEHHNLNRYGRQLAAWALAANPAAPIGNLLEQLEDGHRALAWAAVAGWATRRNENPRDVTAVTDRIARPIGELVDGTDFTAVAAHTLATASDPAAVISGWVNGDGTGWRFRTAHTHRLLTDDVIGQLRCSTVARIGDDEARDHLNIVGDWLLARLTVDQLAIVVAIDFDGTLDEIVELIAALPDT